jgi:hypothetical protein
LALIDKPAAGFGKGGTGATPTITAAELQEQREQPVVAKRIARVEAAAAARAAGGLPGATGQVA